MLNFEDTNRKSKEAMDAVLKATPRPPRACRRSRRKPPNISKKSFQDAVTHFETLSGARSFEAVFELQTAGREVRLRELCFRSDEAHGNVRRHRQERFSKPIRGAGRGRHQGDEAGTGGDAERGVSQARLRHIT